MTTAGVAALLGAGVVVTGIGLAVTPRAVWGLGGAEAPGVAEEEGTAPPESIGGLAELMDSCRGVVAVWDRPGAPATEVLLWHSDGIDSGQVNGSELVLLSFSAVMGTVTATTGEGAWWSESRPDNDGLIAALVEGREGAAERFREAAGTVRRIVATDIADVRVERSGPGSGGAGVTLRLRSGAGTPDVPGEGALSAPWAGPRTGRGTRGGGR